MRSSQPSGTTTSLAPSRASAAPSRSGAHSSSSIRPVEMSQAAMPMAPRTSQTAASTLARRGSSSASSVSVPAVTKRTMSRATSAFDPPRFFACFGRFDLLGDRDPAARLDQPGEIAFRRMHRHAAHRDRLAQMLAPAGQRDVEDLRGRPGIVEEQLEEIAHPVEQQAIPRLRLEREVLRHHRGGW